jgi:outer membrane protein OmpA-like peptidoglycan-associated protein
MARQQISTQWMKAMIVILSLGLLAGCGDIEIAPMMAKIQQALGQGIAEERARIASGEKSCPVITRFSVAPLVVECGGQVMLEIMATNTTGLPIRYGWEIEEHTFETGPLAVWNGPTTETISDPQKVHTVRGVASDGQCAVTKAAQVTVLCDSSFDAMVHFEFARAELDEAARSTLDKIGAKLQENPQHAAWIGGHTDHIGTEPDNKRLGERRAEAVKKYLQENWNVDPSRVFTRSFGEVEPIAPNSSDVGRSQNRRAEIFRVILSSGDDGDSLPSDNGKSLIMPMPMPMPQK